MKKNKVVQNIKKDFIWNTIGASLNAFNSFFFLIIVTRINSIKDAGVFAFAFSFATLLSYVGMYYGRVYQVACSMNNEKDFIVTKIITCSIMMIIAIFYTIIRNYDFSKCLIILVICLAKAIESLEETYYAIMQKNNRLYIVGISLTIRSVSVLIAFIVIDFITKNILLSFSLVIIVYLVEHILCYRYTKRFINSRSMINKENVINILKDGIYPFIISFLMIYIINECKYIIDFTLDDSIQTIFSIIVMPATITLLMVQFVIHPFLNEIVIAYNEKKFSNIKNRLLKFYILIALFGFIVLIGGFFAGIPLLSLVYNVNLINYKLDLMLILIGSIFLGLSSIISNCLIALNDNKKQALNLILIAIGSSLLTYYLISNYKLFGASISYLITLLIMFLLLYIEISKKLRKEKNI